MQKLGFQLLKTRDLQNSINVLGFETNNKIKLPPLYKIFLETFQVGRRKTIIPNNYSYYNKRLEMIRNFGKFKYYPDEDVLIGEFFELAELIPIMVDIYPKEDEIWEMGLLLIGENDMNHSFMVGINEDNQDQIFLERSDLHPRLVFIANNIFELIRGFSIQPQERLLGQYKFNQLYRNWGEDFWRVREDGQNNS